MRIPLHGGIDVRTPEELRLALACLPTPEDVQVAKIANYRERRQAEREAGIVIDDNGRILGDAA